MAAVGCKPEQFASDAAPLIHSDGDFTWTPVYAQHCFFPPEIFHGVMTNLIKNPNILSSWLFRADILSNSEENPTGDTIAAGTDGAAASETPKVPAFNDFTRKQTIIRKLIPRNLKRDDPLDQTCIFYHSLTSTPQQSLVIYLPHCATISAIPFYHPKVRGLAYLHTWDPTTNTGTVSLHYAFFPNDVLTTPSQRAALNIISVVCKHGQGRAAGYEKRVHHDTILPQAAVQNRYHELKAKYARELIDGWCEQTDPGKHVFEDLAIAAFLLELWGEMYGTGTGKFPGFVDIGCGNGLLVHLLNREGFVGWGFDARSRKSWVQYGARVKPVGEEGEEVDSLQEAILLPSILVNTDDTSAEQSPALTGKTHNGLFPKGTFIISNHADELTPWTPILAAISDCPFISIPCCSHNLTGARYRAPPPKGNNSASTYASLVEWVAAIGRDCGWEIETEMLRIPSTRNAALLGRRRNEEAEDVDIHDIIAKYGGTAGYVDNVSLLLKGNARGH